MNKRKCDLCSEVATHHSVEILKGRKIEKHLCDFHAAQQGLTIKAVHTPVNELLTNFVKIHSGAAAAAQDLQCEHCGLFFSKFRTSSLLGCPMCYDAFESLLVPMLEVAHDGASHHVGKVPQGDDRQAASQMQVMSMRKRLAQAVASEDYELAATLRDQIDRLQEEQS